MNKKVSFEFAILVIIIITGVFAYIFWQGSLDTLDESMKMDVYRGNGENKSMEMISNDNKDSHNWKKFRNEVFGYEFSLPKTWRIEDGSGKFIDQDRQEEINIAIEKNEKNYSVQELAKIVEDLEKDASVIELSDVEGVIIEKTEDKKISQTAKILSGNDVITFTFISPSENESKQLFDQIIPTLKSVN